MKTKNTKVTMFLALALTSTSLVLPSVSYANDWQYNQTDQTEEKQNIGGIILGGLTLLALAILAGSGDVESDNGESGTTYYLEDAQQPTSSYDPDPSVQSPWSFYN